MDKRSLFVIMPYVKTSAPVVIRGIPFRSAADLAGLSSENQNHVKTLRSQFFLRNDEQIVHMTYAYLEYDAHAPEETQALFERLSEAQTLVTYCYTRPQPPREDLLLHKEHATFYTLYPAEIDATSAELKAELVRVPRKTHVPLIRRSPSLEGYQGWRDGESPVAFGKGDWVYPPTPRLWLNPSQDLSRDIEMLQQQARYAALVELLLAHEPGLWEGETRYFTALEWYNRSTASTIHDDLALISLALAFESLLNLERGPGLSNRFAEAVLTLLGPIPSLESWVAQFYEAWSKVVHRGGRPHPLWYTQEHRSLKDLSNSTTKVGTTYRPLTVYGRRLFDLCANTQLLGAQSAAKTELSSLLKPNQVRLEEIRKILKQDLIEPQTRLRLVAKDISALQPNGLAGRDQVRLETLIAVGRLILGTYLETDPSIPRDLRVQVEEASGKKPSEGEEKVQQWRQLVLALSEGQRKATLALQTEPAEALEVVLTFFSYALIPPSLMSQDWRPKIKRADDPSSKESSRGNHLGNESFLTQE